MSIDMPSRFRGILLLTLLSCAGLYSVLHSAYMTESWGLGWDAAAYYHAWDLGLYGRPPGALHAYNYSPVFAQIVWPLTFLPWPVFAALWIGAAAVAVLWLVRPLSFRYQAPLLALCSVQVLSGNVDWLMAVFIVLGMSRGAPWLLAAMTKLVSCLGPVWFLARGEWRPLGQFVSLLAAVVGLSYVLSPHLWHEWFAFLLDNADREPGMFPDLLPPWPVRLLAALALTVVAARRSTPWLLAVAMVVVAPVPGTGSWVLFAAIPRLHALQTKTRPENGARADEDCAAHASAQ